MKIVGALFGFLVLAAVFVVWFRMYRSIKGDDSPMFSFMGSKPKKEKSDNSMEALIASYKRGELPPADTPIAPAIAQKTAAPPASANLPPLNPAANPRLVSAQPTPKQSPVVPSSGDSASDGPVVKRESFISGATKLVYLVCRSGLRDHHIFAAVPLHALSTGGAIDPALAPDTVDLLVCNAAMSPVAVIDIIDATSGPANAAKTAHLKSLGVRYLRLSAKSMPRPDALHALIYKM
jgi:hypothetical protein